ncbi:hypothetical protein ROS62_29565 [Streptomyces sp. DSM 41972]|uniref:Uncharacterized protein n=1 Tax=Streptomyces althioticus subsp. attaecolombicae TaxID=3075534 RepID=A0ABU3I7T3_9ACTN|nr:hypothetical protein [Streptomyces sp. DSM 41972]SCD80426.1 hypothetical protein GA0115238_12574 [Streptomyces sp. di50b]SCD95326.1 hypothetical protein GA0115245_11735 [Streptomyces sp. di188]
MSEHTPSQAEGDRDGSEWSTPDVEHTTPSQAEGERDPSDAPSASDDNAVRGTHGGG